MSSSDRGALSSYLVRVMTPAGSTKLGFRTAAGDSALSESLREDGLLLLRSWKLPFGASEGGPARIPVRDEAALNQQLRTLLRRGVPLVEALEVASSVVSARSRARVERMRALVAGGASFAGACDEVGGFDEVTTSVYRAAERTGDLAGAADRLAVAARRRLAIAGKAATVLIYPSVVLVIAVVLLSVLMLVIVPQLAEQIRQMHEGSDGGIPWYSELVFAVSTFLRAHVNWVAVALGTLVALGVVARRAVVSALGAAGRRVPMISRLLLTVEMSRFFSVMAAMTKSGVPLADALSSATGVIGDRALRGQLERLQRRLVEGGVLRHLIEEVDALPMATRRLLVAAERSGDLDTAFDALASDTSDEVEERSARLLAILEPAVIVFIFTAIAPIIVAVAVPMMSVQAG